MAIEISREAKDAYRVALAGRGNPTEHRVTLTEEFYQKLCGGKVSREECIHAAFCFLLDREPKESILSQFELNLITHYFPEFENKFFDYVREKH